MYFSFVPRESLGLKMLAECKRRINNSPEVEIEEAREQLRLINRIRIHKLLEEA